MKLNRKMKKKLRRVLLGEAAEMLCDRLDVQACATISMVASHVLKGLRINAVPQTVSISFATKKWADLIRQHGPKKVSEMVASGEAGDDAWAVGIGYESEHEKAPLHCVLWMPDEGEHGDIIDLTAHQAHRPDRGLIVRPMWFSLDKPLKLPVYEIAFTEHWHNINTEYMERNRVIIEDAIIPKLTKMIVRALAS